MSETLYLFYSKNPLRVVDWRWQMAKHLQANRLNSTRAYGDRHVARAKQFAIELDAVDTDQQHFNMVMRNSDLYQAWCIYQSDAVSKHLRSEVEARLLAAEPREDIARKTGFATGVVDEFGLMFFDVASRLNQTAFITHSVIGQSSKHGISEREPDALWKLFGYFGGVAALDFVAYRSMPNTKPEASSSLGSFFADDFREQMQLKSAIAVRAMQVNSQTQTEIVNVYLRMMELEKQAGSGNGGQESLKQNIQALLENLPWTRDAAKAASMRLIDGKDRGGVGLRADEQLLISAGQAPPDLDAITASAVYPTRVKQTAVTS